MKDWEVIIIGGGIIGLSLAISLRKQGLRVLIVERGEPGREASYAAAGMLVAEGDETPPALRVLAEESARLYPEFAHELEDESGVSVDLRDYGTILLSGDDHFPDAAETISPEKLHWLEPALARPGRGIRAAYLSERSVDPRALTAAAIKAAHHRGVDISSGTEVKTLLVSGNGVTGVQTEKTTYLAPIVVNCAGAWAGCITADQFPVRPVKGQMLSVVGGPSLKHVLRSDEVYVVPRSDGRVVIGTTLENVGYDKRTDVSTIQRLLHAALELAPGLADAKLHHDWAGLRPGTPDDLPVLGATARPGYFVATGHYRDGILLAPITAEVMTSVILGRPPAYDLTNFAPDRFANGRQIESDRLG